MELPALIDKARAGDVAAFTVLVGRFQHLAFGYAVALVRDFALAEDVAQEAFVAAWSSLRSLETPAAFPGWLRGIVGHCAHRVLRRKLLALVPLDEAAAVPAGAPDPAATAERSERAAAVLTAIDGLPAALREVTLLHYVHERSHAEIATFLGLPASTVNNRLHAARAQLKRRMLTMVKETLEANRLPVDFANRIGRLLKARGSVLEALFDPASLPDVLTEMAVSDEANRRAVSVQVVQRLADGTVLCVASAPLDDVPRGSAVLSTGHHNLAPGHEQSFGRILKQLAPAPATTPARLLETGIKVIDVMCPLVAGGTVALAGEWGTGVVVNVEELVRRLADGGAPVSLFALIQNDGKSSFEETWKKEGYSDGTRGAVQTFYLRADDGAWTPERLARLDAADSVIRFSFALKEPRIYPLVDPLTSRSRLLENGDVSPEHLAIAAEIRAALTALHTAEAAGQPTDPVPLLRARKLMQFFGQPYFCAEPYTKRPGTHVPLAEALNACREILDGAHDDLPVEAFRFEGGIDAIREKARRA